MSENTTFRFDRLTSLVETYMHAREELEYVTHDLHEHERSKLVRPKVIASQKDFDDYYNALIAWGQRMDAFDLSRRDAQDRVNIARANLIREIPIHDVHFLVYYDGVAQAVYTTLIEPGTIRLVVRPWGEVHS